jgi:tetratricopeptide (TPR) repeat protein
MLARNDPNNAMLQQQLAGGLCTLGTALMADNKADEALETFQAALAAVRKLAAANPDKIDWQTAVLNTRTAIAQVLGTQGKTAEAVKTIRETIAEGERLAKKAPDDSSVALALALSSANLCVAAVQPNDNATAKSDCARAIEFQRRLIALEPNNAEYKEGLLDLQRQVQLRAAIEADRYAEALELQEQIAARAESVETKLAGQLGENTARVLTDLAGLALLAGEPDKAMAACDRLLALHPGDMQAEINRAHALMYLGRGAEARAIYEAHKADLLPDNKPWPQQVAEDFADLRKAGRKHPQMAEIEAALGTRRTGRANLSHLAVGQDFTPSPITHHAQAQLSVRVRSTHRGARTGKP